MTEQNTNELKEEGERTNWIKRKFEELQRLHKNVKFTPRSKREEQVNIHPELISRAFNVNRTSFCRVLFITFICQRSFFKK